MLNESAETFDPQIEIQKIKEAPKSERAELVGELRAKIGEVAHGITKIGTDVLDRVKREPYVSTEDLMAEIISKSSAYKLTPEDYLIINASLSKFMDDHRKVREVYDRNGGDVGKIFQEVFGEPPHGKVEIVPGPCSLYFKCFADEDMEYIYSKGLATPQPVAADRQKEIKDFVKNTGGFKLRGLPLNGVDGAIITERASQHPNTVGPNQKVYDHELQHILNTYLAPSLELEYKETSYYELAQKSTNESDKRYFIQQYFRTVRQKHIEHRAADELVAYFRGGELNAPYKLKRTKQQGGLYDYYEQAQRYWKEAGFSLEYNATTVLGTDNIDFIKESIEQVFKTEYHELLDEGVKSFRRLTTHGYSRDQAAMLLASTPLARWKKRTTKLALERPIDSIFHVLQNDDLVILEEGKLTGGYVLKEYDWSTGIPVLVKKDDPSKEERVSLADFEYLNYPYKTLNFWFELWKSAGGDSSILEQLNWDLKATETVSASKIWRQLKSYSNDDPNIESVFRTLIKFQKKDY